MNTPGAFLIYFFPPLSLLLLLEFWLPPLLLLSFDLEAVPALSLLAEDSDLLLEAESEKALLSASASDCDLPLSPESRHPSMASADMPWSVVPTCSARAASVF